MAAPARRIPPPHGTGRHSRNCRSVLAGGMDTPAHQHLRPASASTAALAGVIASATVFGMAQGLSYPLFTFLMQKHGMSPGEIGLSAAMTPCGMMVSALLVPFMIRRFGAGRFAIGCALTAASLFVSIGVMQNNIAWYPVRFLLGAAVNPLYILGEVWMIALSPPEKRGRFMGVFNALTGAGFAVGPLSLALVGTDGWPPLFVGIGGFAGCAVLLAFTTRRLAGFEDGEPSKGVMYFWRVAPALLIAVIVSAAIQQSSYSLLPVFGAFYGIAEATLAGLITMMSVGNIVLQLPLGLLAERFSARAMMVACASVSMAGALLLPWLVTTPLVWPLLLIMGGVGYGIYTMTLVELGNRFSGSTLVAGNAAFGLMWGIGGIAGAPVAGLAMQTVGPVGLPAVMAALTALLVGFALYRALTRNRAEAGA